MGSKKRKLAVFRACVFCWLGLVCGCGWRGSRLAVVFDGALDGVHRLAVERVAAVGPVAAAVVGVGARLGGYGHLVVVVEGLGALFQVAFFVVFAPLGPQQQLVGGVLLDRGQALVLVVCADGALRDDGAVGMVGVLDAHRQIAAFGIDAVRRRNQALAEVVLAQLDEVAVVVEGVLFVLAYVAHRQRIMRRALSAEAALAVLGQLSDGIEQICLLKVVVVPALIFLYYSDLPWPRPQVVGVVVWLREPLPRVLRRQRHSDRQTGQKQASFFCKSFYCRCMRFSFNHWALLFSNAKLQLFPFLGYFLRFVFLRQLLKGSFSDDKIIRYK